MNYFFINITSEGVFWKAESMKEIGAIDQLDEFIYNAIELLKNNKKQPNEDTVHVTTNNNSLPCVVSNDDTIYPHLAVSYYSLMIQWCCKGTTKKEKNF